MKDSKPIAVALLSGGVDSTVASAWARKRGFDLYLLSINYGQVMQCELDHARAIGEWLQPVEHKFITVDGFDQLSCSARTHADLIEYDRPIDQTSSDIPSAYPPGRDASFMWMASAWVESLMLQSLKTEAGRIIIGTNKNDAEVFPDCRTEVYHLMNQILAISTKVSVQYGKSIAIETPLIDLTKAGVVQLGQELGVPFKLTWSCYEGKGRACGRCDPCRLRLWAFSQVGLNDPIEYVDTPTAAASPMVS